MKTFFDESERLECLSEMGDQLEKLNAAIDWEMFRSVLNGIYISNDNRPEPLPLDWTILNSLEKKY